jgi:hypothetical protein
MKKMRPHFPVLHDCKIRTSQIPENGKKADKDFLLSFEEGCPDWSLCSAGDLSKYPSVQWKLLNIRNLKEHNIQKHEQGIKKLKDFLFPK